MNKSTSSKCCIKCNQTKSIDGFSLIRGKHSEDRKNVCVQCETKTRKARKLYDLSMEEMDSLLTLPCCICGDKSSKIDLDQNKKPIGSLCTTCYSCRSMDENTILKAYNYSIYVRDFPFYLKWLISDKRESTLTPLLDLMEK